MDVAISYKPPTVSILGSFVPWIPCSFKTFTARLWAASNFIWGLSNLLDSNLISSSSVLSASVIAANNSGLAVKKGSSTIILRSLRSLIASLDKPFVLLRDITWAVLSCPPNLSASLSRKAVDSTSDIGAKRNL